MYTSLGMMLSGTVGLGFIFDMHTQMLKSKSGRLQIVIFLILLLYSKLMSLPKSFQYFQRVDYSDTFGCHFVTNVMIPDTFRTNETLFGLLGTCNFDE